MGGPLPPEGPSPSPSPSPSPPLSFDSLHLFSHRRNVSSNDFPAIESLVKTIIKEKQSFERLVLTKAQLLDLFKHNPFKQRIINEKVLTESTTVYRCGPLIDLCRGPHIRWHQGESKRQNCKEGGKGLKEANMVAG